VPAQVAFVSLALEKAVEGVGPAAFPANDPSGAFALALSTGPEVLGQVVRRALADGRAGVIAGDILRSKALTYMVEHAEQTDPAPDDDASEPKE